MTRCKPNVYYIMHMEIANEMIFLLLRTRQVASIARNKTYMLCMQSYNTVKRLTFADERCNYNFLGKTSIQISAITCVIIVNRD